MTYRRSKRVSSFPGKLVVPPAKSADFRFYSRFECGNLLKAVRVPVKPVLTFSGIAANLPARLEYDLYLDYDTSTDGHMHWYYFQTFSKNLEKGARVRFNIRNLVRGKSLYQDGMLPRVYYEDQHSITDPGRKGWHVDPCVTTEVRFYGTDQNNNFDKEFLDKERSYSTLSFLYEV